MNQYDLRGRQAVVTGGASGLGYAIAERLSASGAKVVIWDRDEKAGRSAAAALAGHFVLVDVSDLAAVTRAVPATLGDVAAIDILVNNAGITGPNVKLWDYPAEAWKEVIAINLDGVFNCCRAVVPHMRARNYGRIVNIASVAGKDGNPNASAYSASKAAVIGLPAHQSCGERDQQMSCQGPCRYRHPGQLRDDSGGAYAAVRADDAVTHRLHALEDPDGPVRRAAGDRGAGDLAGDA